MSMRSQSLSIKELEAMFGERQGGEPIPLESSTPSAFPSGLVSGWFGDMVEAQAAATETPRELSLMLGLSTIAACCQKKFVVQPKPGYFEPLNVFTVCALEPGNRKSAVQKAMAEPIIQWEREANDAIKAEIARAEETAATIEARINSLRGRAAKAKDADEADRLNAQILECRESMPEVPKPPRVWAQDVTPERIGSLMADAGERLAILSSEGGIFDLLGGMYSKGVANIDLCLQAHSGDSARVDRGSRPAIFMKHPALTMGLSPQPGVLRGLAGKPGFRDRGLLARFLYALPASRLGFRTLDAPPVPEHIKGEYHRNIRTLLDAQERTNSEGEKAPYVLSLSPEAFDEWRDFAKMVEPELQPGGQYDHIKDWAGKLPGAAVRLAGLLHCAEHAQDQPQAHHINAETMGRALALAALLSSHALAVFEMMGADPEIEAARRVWAWVERNRREQFTARECFQAVKGSFHRMANLTPAIDVLLERRYLFELDSDAARGRPSRKFEVNPEITKGWA